MNHKILKQEVQTYIRDNFQQDYRNISLQKSPFDGISSSELAQQIKGLQVAKQKFPVFFEKEGFYYPPSLNLEQASSWATACFKTELVQGKTLLDLTAGMGVDSFAFSQHFEEVTSVERNEQLVEICQYNYRELFQQNLKYVGGNFEDFLKTNPDLKWDIIYVDPARRKDYQKKFVLEDLEPNVLEWMEEYLNRSRKVLIKLSPLFDIKRVLEQIPQVQSVYVVAVKNEVKELLVLCSKQMNPNPTIAAVNLESNQPRFEFTLKEEENSQPEYSAALNYLYEPNSAILKGGAFKLLAERFGVKKLHRNTHFYTSENLVEKFPGKIYELKGEIQDAKKEIKGKSFHVISKNYPLSVELIRKKYKLKEGKVQTLLFTQTIEGKTILQAQKIR